MLNGDQVQAASKSEWLTMFRGLGRFDSERYGKDIESVINVGA